VGRQRGNAAQYQGGLGIPDNGAVRREQPQRLDMHAVCASLRDAGSPAHVGDLVTGEEVLINGQFDVDRAAQLLLGRLIGLRHFGIGAIINAEDGVPTALED